MVSPTPRWRYSRNYFKYSEWDDKGDDQEIEMKIHLFKIVGQEIQDINC